MIEKMLTILGIMLIWYLLYDLREQLKREYTENHRWDWWDKIDSYAMFHAERGGRR